MCRIAFSVGTDRRAETPRSASSVRPRDLVKKAKRGKLSIRLQLERRVTPTANISGRLRISCPDSCEAVQSESAVITAFDSELSPAVLSFGEKQPEVLRKSSPKFIHVTCCAASLYVLIQARQSGVPLSMRLAINSAEPWTSTLRRASVRRPLIGFDESRVAADTVGDPSLSPGAYPTSTPVSLSWGADSSYSAPANITRCQIRLT